MMRPKLVEDDGNVLEMLRPRRAVNENVVEKNQHKPPQERPQDVVHQGLEGRRGVGEAERHHQTLVVAMMSAEGRLGDVVWVHPHLMILRAQVELGEETRPMELIEELVYHQDQEFVLGHLGVEGAVVDAETPGLVRLANEEHRRRERRRAGTDDPLCEHGVALPLQLILLQLGVAVRPHGNRGGVRQQVNAVVVRSDRRQAAGLLEDDAVLMEKAIQHGLLVVNSSRCCHRRAWGGGTGTTHALPQDATTPALEGERHGLEVLGNGPQGPQEVDAENEVEAA